MKIHYMSDLHLEFGALKKPLPDGDILLLAGDITICRTLDPAMTSPEMRSVRKATVALNNEVGNRFQRAFGVPGNHEPYRGYYEDTFPRLRKMMPAVRWLDCEAVELDERTLLFGATLWTDMGRGDPRVHRLIQYNMNDFQIVYTRNDHERWTTYDAAQHHENVLWKLGDLANTNKDKTIVVMTHHAPSWQGIDPSHGGSKISEGYASNLEPFITAHPNIRYWVHGHTHIRRSYDVAQCKVMANCRGYAINGEAKGFNPDVSFEVEHQS